MMKKRIITVIVAMIMLLGFSTVALAANDINADDASKGIVKITNIKSAGKAMKVRISKSNVNYDYDLRTNVGTETYPLQLGNGTYKVMVLENTEGNRYKVLSSEDVSLNLTNTNQVFLASIQNVEWTPDMAAIKYAEKVLAGKSGADAKARTIYNYLVNNYKYDWDKLKNVSTGYIPNIPNTYNSKNGICYDYSSMMAGMLRSIGVPTRLVKGYSSHVDGFHAWNEIMIDGKWIIVDSTTDSQLKQAGRNISFAKDSKDYKKVSYY